MPSAKIIEGGCTSPRLPEDTQRCLGESEVLVRAKGCEDKVIIYREGTETMDIILNCPQEH